jgi:GT2 family glycosyltransferase
MQALHIFNVLTGKANPVATPLPYSCRKKQKPRPLKAQRETATANIRPLLNTPSFTGGSTIEWPTPTWFRSTAQADVSVIVPLFKSDTVLEELIQSWDLNPGYKVEVIYVDDHCPNNSKDKVVECWAARKDELKSPVGRIYSNNSNYGFGASCNIGAWYATGKYIIVLNADTVVTSGWIHPIVRLFQREGVGIVGNLQLKQGGVWDGTIDSAGSEWVWGQKSFVHIGRHTYRGKELVHPFLPEEAPPDVLTVDERDMVTGCCMAFERQTFLDFGGFDNNYRVGYWEDSDICMRYKEKGYKVMFQPNSKIYHKLGHSNSAAHPHHHHNRIYFQNKWVSSGRIDPLVKPKRPGAAPEIRSIIVQRQAARGDVLVAAAVVPALKKRYGSECDVIFSTRCPEVLEKNPYITRTANSSSLSERQANLAYNLDMAYEVRPNVNILEAYADYVGVKVDECEFFMHTEEIEVPEEYAVVHAGRTAWAGRDWSPNKFGAISRRLSDRGIKVVCVGSDADHHIVCDLDLRGKTRMGQLAHVIKHAKLFIGIDSFPMHVAQVFSTPGVAFFGSIDGKTRIYRDNMTAATAQIGCLGCHHRKPPPSVVTNVCDNDSLDCINRLSVDEFWHIVEGKL